MHRSAKEAIQLLQKYNIQQPFVDVISIVNAEGIVIEARELEDNIFAGGKRE